MISCPSQSAIFPRIYAVRKMLLLVITRHKPSLPVNWAWLPSSVFLPSTDSLSAASSVHLSSELQHWLAFGLASSPSLISKLSHSWNQDRLLWGSLSDQSNSDLLSATTHSWGHNAKTKSHTFFSSDQFSQATDLHPSGFTCPLCINPVCILELRYPAFDHSSAALLEPDPLLCFQLVESQGGGPTQFGRLVNPSWSSPLGLALTFSCWSPYPFCTLVFHQSEGSQPNFLAFTCLP